MKQILEAIGLLGQKAERVYRGKVDESLRLEAKRVKEEISKLETEFEDQIKKNAKALKAEYQKKFEPLLKEHGDNWEQIRVFLGLDHNKEYSMNVVTGQVFEIVKTSPINSQSSQVH